MLVPGGGLCPRLLRGASFMRFSLRRDDEPIDVLNTMCSATAAQCRWGCGDQCAHPAPNPTENEYFGDVLDRYVSRRALLRGVSAGAAMLALGAAPLVRNIGEASALESEGAAQSASGLNFTPVSLSNLDNVEVPAGYSWRPLIRWGDPLKLDSAPWSTTDYSAADQLGQFGFNCDNIQFFALGANRPGRAALVVNHEYTDPVMMFADYEVGNPTKEQVDYELASHGASVLYIQRDAEKGWVYVPGAGLNRRLDALQSTYLLSGPAAQHDWVRTTEDPHGYYVTGMLNNCGGGKTPWGTALTAEENFNQYFANNGQVTDPAKKAAHSRYGLPSGSSERRWENYYDRFDLTKEPNEPFRFGYIVEYDPQDPNWTPRKRTALGRFKHEAAETVVATNGHVVAYMGDDERFDYMYKFVTKGKYNPDVREANMDLLDEGTLYVAKFHDDGTGIWIPLIQGQGKLIPENGFHNQGDVCILTRLAGDLVGATKMDRPEDFQVNPVGGKVVCALTNNTQRGTSGRPPADAANPRAVNTHGHIMEIEEDGGDHTSLTFKWEIPILCGIPGTDAGTYYGGYDQSKVSPLSSPDNVGFDKKGNLWIATDGQIGTFKKNDGLFAVPLTGPEKGYTRQFLSGVPGGEVAAFEFDEMNECVFVSIQHPGEGSTMAAPTSTFPDGGVPRPTVVVVWKDDGGVIGS